MENYCVDNLVPMNAFSSSFPIEIDLVYAKPQHKDNNFPGLYSPKATVLWADRNIACVILTASILAKGFFKWTLKLNDCLRTVEAQEQMSNYGFHPALVSRPGSGSHPRAMAIDIEPLTTTGSSVDMGTKFDDFAVDPSVDNPAARNFTKGWHHSEDFDLDIWLNRKKLEYVMRRAAVLCGRIIFPLREEWWDFRMMTEEWENFYPLRENDLHPYQRLRSLDPEACKTIKRIEAWRIGESHDDKDIPLSVISSVKFVTDKLDDVKIQNKSTYTK